MVGMVGWLVGMVGMVSFFIFSPTLILGSQHAPPPPQGPQCPPSRLAPLVEAQATLGHCTAKHRLPSDMQLCWLRICIVWCMQICAASIRTQYIWQYTAIPKMCTVYVSKSTNFLQICKNTRVHDTSHVCALNFSMEQALQFYCPVA